MCSICNKAPRLFDQGMNVPQIVDRLSNDIIRVMPADVWFALLRSNRVKFNTVGVSHLAKERFFDYLDRQPRDPRPLPMIVVAKPKSPAKPKRRKGRPGSKLPSGSLTKAGITIDKNGKWLLPEKRP